MVRKCLIFLVIIILFFGTILSVSGRKEHIPLLAVQTNGINETGSIADLYLEITNGEGQIFIDSFPLTKVDTQMSTRFSTMLACKISGKECSNYNFYYTIRADSSIIGGPSASGIIAVLATAMLSGDTILPNISMTGTVNSGSILGPVGGYKAKIDAAAVQGIHTVIIPKGEALQKSMESLQVIIEKEANITVEKPVNESVNKSVNKSLDKSVNESKNGSHQEKNTTNIENITKYNLEEDLIAYGRSINVTVIEAGTVYDALEVFTGKSYYKKEYSLEIDGNYTEIMKDLAGLLCDRNEKLFSILESYSVNLSWYEASNIYNLSQYGAESYSLEKYYSSASYCFGANIRLRDKILEEWNLTEQSLIGYVRRVESEIMIFEETLEKKQLETITDLQTYMVVKERIYEAKQSISNVYTDLLENRSPLYNLAYAEERRYSAEAWNYFFNSKSPRYDFGSDSLKKSCINKLSEADDTFRYIFQD
jgi:uncharacterized protein